MILSRWYRRVSKVSQLYFKLYFSSLDIVVGFKKGDLVISLKLGLALGFGSVMDDSRACRVSSG